MKPFIHITKGSLEKESHVVMATQLSIALTFSNKIKEQLKIVIKKIIT
jgi:hypothetical protein